MRKRDKEAHNVKVLFQKLQSKNDTINMNIRFWDQVKSSLELLVHTIKGDYDSYTGSGNTTNWKRRCQN